VSSEELPNRVFGFNGMFVAPDEDPRLMANFYGERETLESYLGNYRKTLVLKCSGLDAVAMGRRSVPPSDLSLLGLVRHLAAVERFWFRLVLGQETVPNLYLASDDRDTSISDAAGDDECVAEAWAAWRGEVANAEAFLAGVHDLGACVPFPLGSTTGEQVAIRDVVVHMIEEYARHMGHADFLRERIDGRVGQ
jgi:uncharacterized damage-inducible protein DinB